MIMGSISLLIMWKKEIINLRKSENINKLEYLMDVGFSLDKLTYKVNSVLSPFLMNYMIMNLGASVGWIYFSARILFYLKIGKCYE